MLFRSRHLTQDYSTVGYEFEWQMDERKKWPRGELLEAMRARWGFRLGVWTMDAASN